MASTTPSKKPSLSSPKILFKSSSKSAAATTASSPWHAVDHIWTPEKAAPPIRRLRSRSVAFSVKEVKRVALGLRTTPADRGSDLARCTDDLMSIEAQLAGEPDADVTPKAAKAKATIKLPEKYEMLCEFFNCMENSIRLLRLKGSTTTFRNICASVEHLTERRFTYAHLAQLKHLLPEAILFNKVNMYDEATCCMKSELQVNLNLEAVQMSRIKGNLRKVFRERIIAFSKVHPQGVEVPEEQLPHPFNQTSVKMTRNVKSVEPAAVSEEGSTFVSACQQQFMVASHLSRSFQRRFSRKVPIPDSEKTPLMFIDRSCSEDGCHVSAVTSPIRCTSRPPIVPKKSLFCSPIPLASSKCGTSDDQISHVLKNVVQYCHGESEFAEGTPAKQVFAPLTLMIATPEIPTPKRSRTAASWDSPPPKKPARRSIQTKLFTTPTKNTNSVVEDQHKDVSSDEDILTILPKSLLQSIRQKEKKAKEEKEAGVSNAVRHQKMIASLPCMFDMILLIFQSCKRSIMTKQELMHKLISSHSKIVDRYEAEEQFKLLQELAPDWISEKIAYGGVILCCVNKISSAEEIRQRLQDAQ